MNESKFDEIILRIKAELQRAESLYPPIVSWHEGYAIAKEEFDEFWEEIKKYKHNFPTNECKIQKEAEQTIGMLIRTLLDCIK